MTHRQIVALLMGTTSALALLHRGISWRVRTVRVGDRLVRENYA